MFAQVLGALVAHGTGEPLPAALTRAATRIGMIGQAKPGDRTMLDALLPAAAAADARGAADAARGRVDVLLPAAAGLGQACRGRGPGPY